jgi:hypothetical protein
MHNCGKDGTDPAASIEAAGMAGAPLGKLLGAQRVVQLTNLIIASETISSRYD